MPCTYLAHHEPENVNILVTTVECYLLTSSLTTGSAIWAVGPRSTLIQHRLHSPGLAVLHLAACTCDHSNARQTEKKKSKDDCAAAAVVATTAKQDRLETVKREGVQQLFSGIV